MDPASCSSPLGLRLLGILHHLINVVVITTIDDLRTSMTNTVPSLTTIVDHLVKVRLRMATLATIVGHRLVHTHTVHSLVCQWCEDLREHEAHTR